MPIDYGYRPTGGTIAPFNPGTPRNLPLHIPKVSGGVQTPPSTDFDIEPWYRPGYNPPPTQPAPPFTLPLPPRIPKFLPPTTPRNTAGESPLFTKLMNLRNRRGWGGFRLPWGSWKQPTPVYNPGEMVPMTMQPDGTAAI